MPFELASPSRRRLLHATIVDRRRRSAVGPIGPFHGPTRPGPAGWRVRGPASARAWAGVGDGVGEGVGSAPRHADPGAERRRAAVPAVAVPEVDRPAVGEQRAPVAEAGAVVDGDDRVDRASGCGSPGAARPTWRPGRSSPRRRCRPSGCRPTRRPCGTARRRTRRRRPGRDASSAAAMPPAAGALRQVAEAPGPAVVVAGDDADPSVARDRVVDAAARVDDEARRPAGLGEAHVDALEGRRPAEVPGGLRQPRRQHVRPVGQPAGVAGRSAGGPRRRRSARCSSSRPCRTGEESRQVFMSSW